MTLNIDLEGAGHHPIGELTHPLEKSIGVLTLHYDYMSLQEILRRLGTGRFILDALKCGSCKRGLISLMKAPVKVGWID